MLRRGNQAEDMSNRDKRQIKENIKTKDVNEIFGIVEAHRNQYSIAWYLTARNNLQSAKILYYNKRYNHTVFFLQQCIECIVKGILTENDLTDKPKSWGHTPEAAIEAFYKSVEASMDNFTAINNRMAGLVDFESRMRECATIVNEAYTDAKELKDCITKEELYTIEPDIYTHLGLNKSTNKIEAQRRIIDIQFVNILIYVFSKLFNPCQQEARYPEYKNGELILPEKIFSSKSIVDELDTIIKWFDYMFNEIL